MDRLHVIPALSTESVPLSAVTRSIDLFWEDATVHRWDRRRAITVQASPDGVTFPQL